MQNPKQKVGYIGYKIKREVRYQARQTRVHFSKIVSVLNKPCREELTSRPPFAVEVRSEAKSTEKNSQIGPNVMSVLMLSSMGLVFMVDRKKLGRVAQAGPVHGGKVESRGVSCGMSKSPFRNLPLVLWIQHDDVGTV